MAEPIPNPTVSKGPSTYKGVNHHRKVQYSSATYKGDNRYHVLKLGQISYHTLPRSLDAEDTISNTTEPKAPPATEPSAKEPSATELPATEASATEPSATEPLATKPRFSNSIKPSSQALKG
ncbi:MAG: hypothetical protein Q9194_006362 [Teloschistes cf. exilis]